MSTSGFGWIAQLVKVSTYVGPRTTGSRAQRGARGTRRQRCGERADHTKRSARTGRAHSSSWHTVQPAMTTDQKIAEGPCLSVPPELADPLGAVGQREDVEQLSAGSRPEGVQAFMQSEGQARRTHSESGPTSPKYRRSTSAALEGDDRHRRGRHPCPSVRGDADHHRGGVRASKPEKTNDLPAPHRHRGVKRVGRSMLAALGPADAGAAENRPFDDRAVSMRRGLDDRGPGKFEHLRRWHRRSAGSRGWRKRDSTALRVLPIEGHQHPHPSNREGGLPHTK